MAGQKKNPDALIAVEAFPVCSKRRSEKFSASAAPRLREIECAGVSASSVAASRRGGQFRPISFGLVFHELALRRIGRGLISSESIFGQNFCTGVCRRLWVGVRTDGRGWPGPQAVPGVLDHRRTGLSLSMIDSVAPCSLNTLARLAGCDLRTINRKHRARSPAARSRALPCQPRRGVAWRLPRRARPLSSRAPLCRRRPYRHLARICRPFQSRG